ncbi:hypothetical protein [Psittacicella hinzii]|uniref:Uncharacterized protein n=1 Tax=Psittacicella hinzii TaxID=2028575 RepID=A0A3A1YRH9_9GAMM|nr:hypothetical protein [Psittacicella hinzii]RIY38994.1 hypothetical protein CKF58_03010 [Psittacicella hinzii]
MLFSLLEQYPITSELKADLSNVNNDLTKANALFTKHKEQIRSYLDDYKQKYRSYITQNLELQEDELVGVVDITAGVYKAQKVVENLVGDQVKVLGLYYANIYERKNFIMPHLNYARESVDPTKFLDMNNIYGPNWDVFEYTCSAPSLTATEVSFKQDKQPVITFEDRSKAMQREVFFADHNELIHTGQQDYAQNILERFGNYQVKMNFLCTFGHFLTFINNPTIKDIKTFAKIEKGLDQSYEVRFNVTTYTWKDVFTKPKQCLRNLRKIIWRTPLQTFATSLLPPIAIKIRGIRHISVHLAPYAQKRYGSIGISFKDGKYFYGIVFGSKYA